MALTAKTSSSDLAQWHNWEREDAPDFELQILACSGDTTALSTLADAMPAGVSVPAAYFEKVSGCAERSTFFTACIKGALEMQGYAVGAPLPPQAPLSEAGTAEVRTALDLVGA